MTAQEVRAGGASRFGVPTRFAPQAACALLALLAAHWPALSREFVWDDRGMLAHVAGAGKWSLLAPDPFGCVRPGKTALFSLLRALFGENPPAWNLLALAALALATLGLLALARRILPPGPALAAALVYAAHPLHVEGAFWLSAANGTLLAACAAGYYLLWFRDMERPDDEGAAALAFLFAAALALKEEAVALPLCGDLLLRARGFELRRRDGLLIAGQGFLALLFLAYTLQRSAAAGREFYAPPAPPAAMAAAAPGTSLLHALWFLLPFRWMFYPSLRLGPLALALLAAAGWAALLAALRAARRARPGGALPLPAALALFSFAALAPASNWIPFGNDWFGARYLSHAGFGLALLAGWALDRAARRPRLRLPACLALLAWLAAALPAAGTFHRDWATEERLFERLARENESALHDWRLGHLRFNRGEFAAAAALAERAVGRDPAMGDAHALLGLALARLGRPEEAAAAWRRGLELCPGDRGIAVHLARYHDDRYDASRAPEDLAAADRLYAIAQTGADANAETAYVNRGRLWMVAGDRERALRLWREGLDRFPRSAALRANLARAGE